MRIDCLLFGSRILGQLLEQWSTLETAYRIPKRMKADGVRTFGGSRGLRTNRLRQGDDEPTIQPTEPDAGDRPFKRRRSVSPPATFVHLNPPTEFVKEMPPFESVLYSECQCIYAKN